MENTPQKYINTPFAYTRFSKNLSLLQQDIMNKVSAQLQTYLNRYFLSDRKNDKRTPKSFLSEAEKNSLETIYVSFAELGVAPNNYPALHDAVSEVLRIQVDAPSFDEKGRPVIRKFNIFTETEAKLDGRDFALFKFNKDVIDYVLDITEGYISHPEDIAQIARIERMPLIYYLVKHESQSWKKKQVRLSLFEIKDYLGFVKRMDGEVVKVQYKKFSQFKERVLNPAVKDINTLHDEGKIDIGIRYEPDYGLARKVGDPGHIIFYIDTSKSKVLEQSEAAEKKNTEQSAEPDLFAQAEPMEGRYLKGWEYFMTLIKDVPKIDIWTKVIYPIGATDHYLRLSVPTGTTLEAFLDELQKSCPAAYEYYHRMKPGIIVFQREN